MLKCNDACGASFLVSTCLIGRQPGFDHRESSKKLDGPENTHPRFRQLVYIKLCFSTLSHSIHLQFGTTLSQTSIPLEIYSTQTSTTKMQFSLFAVIATLATIVATSPTVDSSPAGVLRGRAINYGRNFTEAELADKSE